MKHCSKLVRGLSPPRNHRFDKEKINDLWVFNRSSKCFLKVFCCAFVCPLKLKISWFILEEKEKKFWLSSELTFSLFHLLFKASK